MGSPRLLYGYLSKRWWAGLRLPLGSEITSGTKVDLNPELGKGAGSLCPAPFCVFSSPKFPRISLLGNRVNRGSGNILALVLNSVI